MPSVRGLDSSTPYQSSSVVPSCNHLIPSIDMRRSCTAFAHSPRTATSKSWCPWLSRDGRGAGRCGHRTRCTGHLHTTRWVGKGPSAVQPKWVPRSFADWRVADCRRCDGCLRAGTVGVAARCGSAHGGQQGIQIRCAWPPPQQSRARRRFPENLRIGRLTMRVNSPCAIHPCQQQRANSCHQNPKTLTLTVGPLTASLPPAPPAPKMQA